MWQARHIQARLLEIYPALEVTIHGMTTEGDRKLDSSLARIGGKGLFVKELEEALARGEIGHRGAFDEGRADGISCPARPCRDARKSRPARCLRSTANPNSRTAPGARVGTSSLRRESQLRARRAARIEPLRATCRLGFASSRRQYDDHSCAAGLKRPARSTDHIADGHRGDLPAADRARSASSATDRESISCVCCARWITRRGALAWRASGRCAGSAGSCNVPLAAYGEMSARACGCAVTWLS